MIEDGNPHHEHCSLDFTAFDKKAIEKKSKLLRAQAETRGWLFRGGCGMKYAAYSKYKPSPMAWLDQLPTHWNAASLRWMSKRYAGGTPDKGNEAYWEDGEIPWINSGASERCLHHAAI